MRVIQSLVFLCWAFGATPGLAFLVARAKISKSSSSSLDLWGIDIFGGNPFGFKSKAESEDATKGAKAGGSAAKTDIKPEKISNTQGRDWVAEGKKIEAEKAPKRVYDLQPKSFNYGKSGELPYLYKGWLKSGGDTIATQMISACKKAISQKFKAIEVLFDPVPNLDEVTVGTVWNFKFRNEVSTFFKVPDFAVNRGATSLLEWATLYWGSRLALGLGGKVLLLSVSGEGTRGQYLPALPKGVTLVSLSDIRNIDKLVEPNYKPQAVIILSPCTEGHYASVKSLAAKFGDCPAIAVNAPFSCAYDVGGPKSFELAYVMKRIPKGWIFRNMGGSGEFQAIVEGPDYEMTKTMVFPTRPTLPEISKINMAKSESLYGRAGNDRIFEQRL